MRVDSTLALLAKGYAWLPDRRRRSADGIMDTRLMGRRTVGIAGPEAARFFYDEQHVRRAGAVPEPVLATLFGHGAVHTLDGAAHRHRKALFLRLLDQSAAEDVASRAASEWDRAAAGWAGRDVVLFDETTRILTAAVTGWAGVPVDPADQDRLARDLVAMVDGFATAGPRHWRARRARARREDWLAGLVTELRAGRYAAPDGSPLGEVARHRELDGAELPPRVAAVELLNLLRPTVAVTWFVSYAAHALHRWPEHRERLAEGDPAFATAFAHEVRRLYPFAPLVGGRAACHLEWRAHRLPAGGMLLLDLYGQNHDPQLFADPYRFDPDRFLNQPPGEFDLVPQGGGDPATGHRCPGEPAAVALLRDLGVRLARLDWTLPPQDLSIPLRRVPPRVASGVVLSVGPPEGDHPNRECARGR